MRARRGSAHRQSRSKRGAQSAASVPPHWKKYEIVVAAIERSLNAVPSARVVPNAKVTERIGGKRRQVDVLVEIPTGLRLLRIGVEVRDRSLVLDIEDVEQSITKLKKLDLDYGVIVSRSGFTPAAVAEAARHGIELRTVAAVESPGWWLASTMTNDLRQIELVHMQINFRTEQLPVVRELLAGSPEIDVTDGRGAKRSLRDAIAAYGIDAVGSPEHASLGDQETFAVRINPEHDENVSLICPRGALPWPQNIVALYRVHRQIERVALSAYGDGEALTAFSGVSAALQKQITFVTKQQADGSRMLHVSLESSRPSATDIPTRPVVEQP